MARAILTVVATLGALWVCILLLCLVNHLHIDSATGLLQRRWGKGPFARQQQLAYDGPYDTPPVTWYYPATTNNENTLGYTWDKADMQNTAVTYEPGIMNPLGSGIEYQNQEEMHPGLAAVKQRARTQLASFRVQHGWASREARKGGDLGDEVIDMPIANELHDDGDVHVPADLMDSYVFKRSRALHPLTLKFIQARDEAAARGWPLQFQSLADSDSLDDMVDSKEADAISGSEDLLSKKLDAAFSATKSSARHPTHKPEGKSFDDMEAEMGDMRLSDELLDAAGSSSAKTRGKRGRNASRDGTRVHGAHERTASRRGVEKARRQSRQRLAYSADPWEVDPHASTSPQVEVNGAHFQASYSAGGNIAGPAVVNLAESDDTSGPKFARSDQVQLQSPAIVTDVPPGSKGVVSVATPSLYPVPGPVYGFHVGPGVYYAKSVKPEEWGYNDEDGRKDGPSFWGSLKGAWGRCKSGTNQSPVNLELNIRRDDELKMLRWIGPNDPYQATVVSPLYKNVVTIEGLKGSMMLNDVKMELKSASIHTPSEHKLQGRRMPGEVQFLHETVSGTGRTDMIVSVFLEVGVATAPSLQDIMALVGQFLGTQSVDGMGRPVGYSPPALGLDVKPAMWVNTALLAADVLGTGSNYANYYTYYGSLTRPPCDEGVTWIILKTPLLVSPDHHSDLLSLQGYTARPTQAMNRREVYDTGTGHYGQNEGFQSPTMF